MNQIKKYSVALVGLCFGLFCLVRYQMIGSYVAADGMLVEPFYLIPLGYMGLLTAVVSFLVIGLKARTQKLIKKEL